MNTFKIVNPGLFTTIQDRGRWGYQQYGVSVGGVMDLFSMETANLLVGNDPSEGVLEMTLIGPELLVQGEAVIAVCGANLDARINDKPLPLWTAVPVRDGDELSFPMAVTGLSLIHI